MLLNIIAALLGLLFVTLAKMQSLKKDFAVANQPFVLSKFFAGEFIGILMSLIFIVLMAITVQEWVQVSKYVEIYLRIIFAMGGAIGSWAFLLFLGKSKKFIRNKIDEKTNIADGINPPTNIPYSAPNDKTV